MGICRIRKTRHLAVGDEVPVAFLPVRQICRWLLPVDEGCLITPVIQAAHGVQMRSLPTNVRASGRAASRPCGSRGLFAWPAHPRRGCLAVRCLLHHCYGAGEELIEERRVPEPEPGNHDERHRCLPRPGMHGPAGADDLPDLLTASMPKTAEQTRDRSHTAIARLWTRRGPPAAVTVRPEPTVTAWLARTAPAGPPAARTGHHPLPRQQRLPHLDRALTTRHDRGSHTFTRPSA